MESNRRVKMLNDIILYFCCTDQNPYYKESEENESGFVSPGYPVNFLPEETCEIYIKAKNKNHVIHLRFSELFLFSRDNVTVYDPHTGDVLKSYNNETDCLLVSVTSKIDSLRVLFNSTDKISDASTRRFGLVYQSFSPGKDVCISVSEQSSNVERPL